MENITSLLKHVKRQCGLVTLNLPIPDEDLIDVLKEETLKTFSRYYPLKHNISMNLNENCIDEIEKTYKLDLSLLPKGCDIIDVNKIKYKGIDLLPAYLYAGNADIESTLYTSAIQNFADAADQSPICTFEYIRPDVIKFYNMYSHFNYNDLIVETFISNPDNLSTIPETVMEDFKRLAVLDIKIFLYNTLKPYNNIETAFGTINLKIDDWEGASSMRDDLINKYDNLYILNPQFDKIYYI